MAKGIRMNTVRRYRPRRDAQGLRLTDWTSIEAVEIRVVKVDVAGMAISVAVGNTVMKVVITVLMRVVEIKRVIVA